MQGNFTLFYIKKNGKLILIAAKIVDDIFSPGEHDAVNDFIKGFKAKFKFGTVVNGPGNLLFYGMNIV